MEYEGKGPMGLKGRVRGSTCKGSGGKEGYSLTRAWAYICLSEQGSGPRNDRTSLE